MLVLVLVLRVAKFAKQFQGYLRAIQEDGRVMDYQDSDRSISEGQAYGMLCDVLK